YLDTLAKDAPSWKTYLETFIDRLTWMKSVAGMGPDPWHMHPVVFLDALNSRELIRVDDFLEEYESQHISFTTGTPALSISSKTNLKKLILSINSYYSMQSEYKPNRYTLAYMLATARHETYHFPTGEFFSEKPEVGGVDYFNMYDPILADTQRRKETAISNENTLQGDGYLYRGRGCVHLTWKINYRKAKEKFNVDFVSDPELASDLNNAVPIMVWGMEEGVFTGKRLSNYINDSEVNYEGARRIINGNDQKVLIASYALKFQEILEKTSSLPESF
ncbi:hypothetical protein ABEI05_24890, partial [Erwinia billingiae]